MNMLKKSSEVAAEVRARVMTCRLSQGAETDIGRTVYQGRRRIDNDMIPCVSIIEARDNPESPEGRKDIMVNQEFLLFAYFQCDSDNPNIAAHAAIRDLKRCIFKDGARFGGKVVSVSYMGRDIGPRSDGENFSVAAIEISVKYAEDLTNP